MLVALLLAGTVAQYAHFQGQDQNVPVPVFSTSNNVQSLTYPSLEVDLVPFDVSLGTLTSVTIYWSSEHQMSPTYENITSYDFSPWVSSQWSAVEMFTYRPWTHANNSGVDAGHWEVQSDGLPWWFANSDVTGSAHVRLVGNSGTQWIYFHQNFNVPAFDGTLDFAGASAWTEGYNTYSQARQVDITSPGELAQFSDPNGDGVVPIFYTPRFRFSMSAAPELEANHHWYQNGNFKWIANTAMKVSQSFLVVYTYQ